MAEDMLWYEPQRMRVLLHIWLYWRHSQQRKSVCISGKWYRACQHVKEIHVSFCEVAYDQTHVLHEIFVERERPLKLVIWTNGLCSLQGLSWWHKDMGKRMKKTTNPRQGRRRRTWKKDENAKKWYHEILISILSFDCKIAKLYVIKCTGILLHQTSRNDIPNK